MRRVWIPGTDMETSCLGMGCASLGSRISRRQGLRMLAAAYERGVTWYDVAPSYGAGEAEGIFGEFLETRRDRVFLCSKVGLVPPRYNTAIKLLYTAGRPMIGVAKALRRGFRSLSATRNVRAPLTPDLIETSIQASLSRLRTDHLDVFALHDPDPADLGRDEILAALEKARARGQTRHISIAGSFDAACHAAESAVFSFFQLADDPLFRPLPRLRDALQRPAGFVTHSVLGVGGAKDRVARRLAATPVLMTDAAAAGYTGSAEQVAAALLMRRAFVSNPKGIVLASMFTGNHLADNVGLASQPLDPGGVLLLDRILAD